MKAEERRRLTSAVAMLRTILPVFRCYVEEFGPTPGSDELAIIEAAEALVSRKGPPA